MEPRLVTPHFDDLGVRIGLVLLSSDQNGERAFRQIAEGAGASCYSTRVVYHYGAASPEQEDAELMTAANQILPDSGIDVLAYSCTSRSAEKGEAAMIDLLAEARPGVVATTPLLAARLALTALGARKVAVLSPYKTQTHETVVTAIEAQGFEIAGSATFDLGLGTEFARLTPGAIVEAATTLAQAKPDAIFVSCTGIRAPAAIEAIEDATGVPVVTSSQALAWHALALGGLTGQGPGKLFETDPRPC
ncbi:MAG: Asp/Glu racemase [Pseudomonadota bacterium]|nr:Asp/Glu racemase [Pseudomonadota bacterium]